MSQENVDVIRAAIEAMNRRDIEGVLRLMDPGVRFEHRLAALEGNFVGVDGVRGWFADLLENFDAWQIDCSDIRDLGDRVLALGTIEATGRTSGAETELPITVVARFKDERITHFTDFGDEARALEAVGLSAWSKSGSPWSHQIGSVIVASPPWQRRANGMATGLTLIDPE